MNFCLICIVITIHYSKDKNMWLGIGRKEFRRLRRYLKNNPHIIEELIGCPIRHDPSRIYNDCVPNSGYLQSLHPFAPILYELLHIVVQLGGNVSISGNYA